MAISLSTLQRGIQASPPIICCYGDEGIGKTRMAANAPNPVFIFTENSKGKLDVAGWTVTSYEEVMEATVALLNDEHDFKTVVYDSLDWFEPMVWRYMISQQPTSEKGKPIANIEDYGFGKGYKYALDYWRDFLDLVDQLRTKKDMAVIFLAHPTLTKISPPDGDSYDAWTLKLQNSDKTSAKDKITEYCDMVLFANWKSARTEEELGFGNTRARAVGNGERIVNTEKRPAFDAKNRYDLPAQIHIKDKDWSELWSVIAENTPWFKQFAEPEAKPEPKAVKKAEPKAVAPETAPVAETPAGETLPKFLQKKG
jgi:hypothetical protein